MDRLCEGGRVLKFSLKYLVPRQLLISLAVVRVSLLFACLERMLGLQIEFKGLGLLLKGSQDQNV